VDMGLSNHLVMMWIVCGLAVLFLSIAARGQSGVGLVMRGGVESVVIYLRDELLHPIFHEHTDTYLPYFLSLFFFILIANLCGLVPYGSAITGNISVTAALSFCTFMLVHFAGIKEQGPIEYVKHICPGGVPWWLMPLIFLIEIMGLVAKCVALSIRLFANILAGHVVSLAFLSLIFIFAQMHKFIGLGVAPAAVGLALFVYTLDLLVSLLQAYIFTFLTALFVGAAVHPH
jgi:F-type H+-transporting ATPase subunit a